MGTFSYILCICCDIVEKNGLLVFMVGNQVPRVADSCKTPFGVIPNVSTYANMFLKFYVCCNIS